MTTSLAQATQAAKIGAGQYRWRVEDGWQQGRGAYGGLVLGSMVRAASAEVDQSRTLRAVNGEILAPVANGEATITVESLRVSNNVSTLSVRVLQAGEVCAHAVVIFGAPRKGTPTWRQAAAPAAIAQGWTGVEPLPIGPPLGPVFAQNFEFRVLGAMPFSQSQLAETKGWIRPHKRAPLDDGTNFTAMIDVWFPAFLTTFETPRPVGTISFALEVFGDTNALDPEAPFFHVGTAPHCTDGYALESREIWGHDGRLLALNQQVMVIIK